TVSQIGRDLLAAGLARDGGRSLRSEAGEGGAEAQRYGSDVHLTEIALDGLHGRLGYVLRAARPHTLWQLHARLREHARLAYETGEDSGDAHAGAVQLGAHRSREATQAELGGVVDRAARRRRLARQRGHEQQVPAPALHHLRRQRVSHRDRSTQVHVERAIDLLHRERVEQAARGERRIGNEDVQLTGL